jgi:ATP-binding cassette subfamily F protein uup
MCRACDEARRASLARVLAPLPDILLLDEPTNHLDLTTIEWLERELERRRAALVMISHDRRFLSNLSRSTVWLDRGETRRVERGFADFESWRDEVLEEEERNQHKLDRKIVAEEHWLRYGVSGRRKRNVKRLATLHSLREARRAHRGPAGSADITASEAARSGVLVVEAKGRGSRHRRCRHPGRAARNTDSRQAWTKARHRRIRRPYPRAVLRRRRHSG